MKEWRVIVVLLAIIILFGVILGVKIINNTPEKQQEKMQQYYDNDEHNSNINETKYESVKEYNIADIQKEIKKSALKQSIGIILIASLVIILLVISNVKICNKLGIDGLIIKAYIISCIVSFTVIFTFNSTLSNIASIISGIISIILLIMQYKVLGINPWLLLLVFIPVVGVICVVILGIYGQCKLAAYFGKGTLFQLGLIFLPIIFIPILAFTTEE